MSAKGLSLMSGGLDSQLAVRILERAGAEVEAVCFNTPFFDITGAEKAAKALGVKLHLLDFLEEEIELIETHAHGFGGAMNPCIDCHARMIERAGELMTRLGYDFVATGEVQGQRPMSQNRQSMGIVEKCSKMKGRLVRPLSAKLLEPTLPELEGKLDREKLYDISGRGRERQIALAAEFGLTDYPAPAGGCKLTEAGFCRKLKDLQEHEGLRLADGTVNRAMITLLKVGRRFRFPRGTSVVLGRDARENSLLRKLDFGEVILPETGVIGPTALVPRVVEVEELESVRRLVAAYVKGTTEKDRLPFKPYQIC